MANDGGIHFPPGQRREKPAFEPPPWEAEQFEKLAQRKQEPEQEPAATEDLGLAVPVAGESNARPPEEREARESPAETTPPDRKAKGPAPLVDEARIEALMTGLRAEEPRSAEAYWPLTAAGGVLCALIGLALLTWAVVGLVTLGGGARAMWLVLVLSAGGASFLGGGAWLILKSLRQQGVL